MGYYAYKGTAKLGMEPVGSSDRMLWRSKTRNYALKQAKLLFGKGPYKFYSFLNFYDNRTFQLVYEQL